jgi:hypothetical protein
MARSVCIIVNSRPNKAVERFLFVEEPPGGGYFQSACLSFYSLGIMRPLTIDALKVWRWILIVVQTVVFVTFSAAVTLEFGFGISIEPQPESLEIALGISYMAALLFLLIASPFFFKSLGKLARIGWIIAFAILVISICFPARSGHL